MKALDLILEAFPGSSYETIYEDPPPPDSVEALDWATCSLCNGSGFRLDESEDVNEWGLCLTWSFHPCVGCGGQGALHRPPPPVYDGPVWEL